MTKASVSCEAKDKHWQEQLRGNNVLTQIEHNNIDEDMS